MTVSVWEGLIDNNDDVDDKDDDYDNDSYDDDDDYGGEVREDMTSTRQTCSVLHIAMACNSIIVTALQSTLIWPTTVNAHRRNDKSQEMCSIN